MLAAGPPTATPEPSRHLAPAARRLWRIEGALAGGLALAAAGVLQAVAGGTLAWLGWIAAIALAVLASVAVPELRWRRWRWEVRDEEIDLRHGALTEVRTIVPMARVQHVDSEVGPLERRLGLASVWVHTASGAFEIPALDAERARELRVRIARLARVSDEL